MKKYRIDFSVLIESFGIEKRITILEIGQVFYSVKTNPIEDIQKCIFLKFEEALKIDKYVSQARKLDFLFTPRNGSEWEKYFSASDEIVTEHFGNANFDGKLRIRFIVNETH